MRGVDVVLLARDQSGSAQPEAQRAPDGDTAPVQARSVSPSSSDSDGACAASVSVREPWLTLCHAADEPSQGAAGWVVGALNGINCRITDVSVALSYGNQQSVRVAVGLAHALTVTADGASAESAELSLERLCKEVLLERVRVELSHAGAQACFAPHACELTHVLAGCALAEPLLHVEKCALHAVLPLFSGQDAHAAVRLSLESSPVVLSWCAQQLQEAGALFKAPAAAGGMSDTERLEEARRVQSRQAEVIAHLLTVNDELESRVEELEVSNIALSAALERHVAVVATLAAENAAMLELA